MRFMGTALPWPGAAYGSMTTELILLVITAAVSVAGIVLAWYLFLVSPGHVRTLSKSRSGVFIHRLWSAGWGFDWIYDTFIVRPFVWAAKVNRDDFIDLAYLGVIRMSRGINRFLVSTQTGKIRWYAAGIALGAAIVLGLVVFS